MTDLNLNDTVSLGRNIIAFVKELKGLFSSVHRSQTHYLRYIHEKLVEQNDIFQKLAADYFSIISRMRSATQNAKSSKELFELYQPFMEERDMIVVPRGELFGEFQGVERVLENDAPIDLKPFLNEYKEFLEAVEDFFSGDTQISGSPFSHIFQKARYAFDRKEGENESKADYDDMDNLEDAKRDVIKCIDEVKVCMEAARTEAANKFSYLKGRLEAKV